MKVSFENREKMIISGLLSMALGAAMEDKNRKMRKYTKKLVDKFQGEGEVNLKQKEIEDIRSVLITVIKDTEFDLPEGELPKISKEDYDTCKSIEDKLTEVTK